MESAVREWLLQYNKTSLEFQTYVWGTGSDYIFGDVLELWKTMQSAFAAINENDRLCHTAVRC